MKRRQSRRRLGSGGVAFKPAGEARVEPPAIQEVLEALQRREAEMAARERVLRRSRGWREELLEVLAQDRQDREEGS